MAKHQEKGTTTRNGIPHVQKAAHRQSLRQKVTSNPFDNLRKILRQLEEAKSHFEVRYHRYDAIPICANVPGERWEIDVLEDGDIDFERFVSAEGVRGEEDLTTSIRRLQEFEALQPEL